MADPTSDGGIFPTSAYVGTHVQNILYGVELFLYFETIHILLMNRGARKKSDLFYAFFSTMMVFCATIWVTVQAVFNGRTWLAACNSAGVSAKCWRMTASSWYIDIAATALVALQFMTDALMIHRCRVIWNSYRVVAVPIILLLITLVLAFLVGWAAGSPGGNFFAGLAVDLGVSYYTVSVFLNTTMTCVICYRVVRHGKRVQAGLGRAYASLYLTIATIIVESVLPYTLSGIAFLVSYGMESPTSVAFGYVYDMMMCISPQMLILRVISGVAWDGDTFKPPGSIIEFSPGSTSVSQGFDGNEASVRPETVPNICPADRHSKI